jgi:hypothetical protein
MSFAKDWDKDAIYDNWQEHYRMSASRTPQR